MAIKINGQDLQKRFINGQEIVRVYENGGQIRPETIPVEIEYIEYKMYTDGSHYLSTPISGVDHNGDIGVSYDWNISIDGGTATRYTGVSGQSYNNSYITLQGTHTEGVHTIRITPVTKEYGWALAFSFQSSYAQRSSVYITEIVYDGSYMGYAENATSTGDYFRWNQYKGCQHLTASCDEYLPDTVLSIGDYFRLGQYQDCTALISAGDEFIPDSVIIVGDGFRRSQYSGCTALTSTAEEVMPNSITSIGNYFRAYQYATCTSLTTANDEVLSTSITTISDFFRGHQYDSCTSLQIASTEMLPMGVEKIYLSFRRLQYVNCTSLTTTSVEALPTSVTNIYSMFRHGQYSGCTSLTNIRGMKNLNLSADSYRSGQFFYCTSSKTITTISDVGTSSGGAFLNASEIETITQVNVPSVYLQNYIDTTAGPRASIDDNKFIGY